MVTFKLDIYPGNLRKLLCHRLLVEKQGNLIFTCLLNSAEELRKKDWVNRNI
jgi:hypothetical protein